MPVDRLDGRVVCNRDVVWLDADYCSVLLMSCMHGGISSSSTALVQQPEVGELGWEWSRDGEIAWLGEIRDEIVEENENNCGVGSEQEPVGEGHCR